jgi:hypothetical protein
MQVLQQTPCRVVAMPREALLCTARRDCRAVIYHAVYETQHAIAYHYGVQRKSNRVHFGQPAYL